MEKFYGLNQEFYDIERSNWKGQLQAMTTI